MKRKIACCTRFLFVLYIFTLSGINACSDKETYPKREKLLTFSVPDSISPHSSEELAILVITASGGRLPYEFYVIPETQWLSGDCMKDMLTGNDFSRLYLYTYTIPVVEVKPGSPSTPNYYWVSVQDASESGTVSGTNLMSWWQRVAVYGL